MGARELLDEVAVMEAAREALDALFARVWAELKPPEQLTLIEWAERYRILSEEETSNPGKYSLELTPTLRGILAAASDPDVRKIACQKSAQWGYTAGVVCNVIGYHIHWRPSVQVILFPREKSGKDFAAEKLEPMIRATPVLAARVDLKSRAAGQGTTRRSYRGGLLKLVASNSASDVKSTSGRIGICEEPDDANRDVAGQGNSITLLRERTKTYAPDDLQLIGGTPTAKQTSLIVKEMRTTDQRYFHVECHDCGESHTPVWANVTIPGYRLSEEDLAMPREELDAKWPEREVYGRARWEEAYYSCPHCGSVWTEEQRIENIKRAARVPPLFGWVPTAKSATPGFYGNELLSIFDGSRVPLLAEKFLVADHEYQRGEPEKMVVFVNSTLGQPWEYRGDLPEEDELRERAEAYAEWTCPTHAYVEPVVYVDVQHDRLAVTVWCVGYGEEMWLAHWGEYYGKTIVSHAGAWLELEQLLERTVRHASGAALPIMAVAIDTGDGQTSDAAYDFVRTHNTRARPVLACKGASDKVGRVEIWTKARPIDPHKRPTNKANATKASKYGVHVHIIGAAKGKDLILGWAQEGGRVRLEGSGPGRMHWYEGVRDDFFEQLLGEMKIPDRLNPRIRVWTERTDRRNEALDCTVGCVWISRFRGLHLRKASKWQDLGARLLQASLLGDDDHDEPDEPADLVGPPPAPREVQTSAPAPIAPMQATPPLQPRGGSLLKGFARFAGGGGR